MLHAQTIAEIHFYLKITGCEKCGRAVHWNQDCIVAPAVPGTITVSTDCSSCGALSHAEIRVAHASELPPVGYPPVINPTDRASRLIDLSQWITLAHLLIEESRGQKDKELARYLNLQAAQCYDEALKFYDDPDNELPQADAFFSEPSRRRFRESPQQFARSRLIGERARLPSVIQDRSSPPP